MYLKQLGMMKFSRYISTDFVKALNLLYGRPEGLWWKKFLDDKDIFVAIRAGYLNAYYRGCSLAKITFNKDEVFASTHYKYLLKPDAKPITVIAREGRFDFDQHRWRTDLSLLLIDKLSETELLKRAANAYVGVEKKFVGDVVKGNLNVMDVEIAHTRMKEATADAPSTDRIDLAAVRERDDGLELVMYEVKLFSNKELRAGKADKVQVVDQIERYEEMLREHNLDMRESFLRSSENILRLDGVNQARKDWARRIVEADSRFTVRSEPVLIVGGFDDDQKRGEIWCGHLSRLRKELGEHRVITRGNAKSVKLTAIRAASAAGA